MQHKAWPILKPGDAVEVIAPAGRVSEENLAKIVALLTHWKLQVKVADDILGDDLLCANSDAARFQHLKQALFNSSTKAIICARGGYGAMRLLPELFKLQRPPTPKLLLGMSDITALQIFLQQQWGWSTLHGSLAVWHLTETSLAAVRQIIFGEIKQLELTDLTPLNNGAKQTTVISSSIVGGNLCLVQCSLATPWQFKAEAKIILLEEINERAYKVDRMLEQLYQANIFANAKAIVFGDFMGGEEPNGASLIMPVLRRFAERISIPVLQIKGVGHGAINQAIPLGTAVKLITGVKSSLSCPLI